MLSSSSTVASNLGSYAKLSPEQVENIKSETKKRLAGLRSWSEFFSYDRFIRPTDYNTFQTKLSFNVKYFQNNYLLIILVVVAYFLITNLWLLLSMVYFIGGYKFILSLPTNQPSVILGVQVSQGQLWLMYGIVGFLLYWVSGVTTTIVYVVSVCALFICIHGGCMEKPLEAEFDDQEFGEVMV
ncbi:PRA1 family protein-domain-containing protein [Globomyces pollinis-pini]|nr:PRA1 family protein-domain-containing protein [Globomyces pollinis-pini]